MPGVDRPVIVVLGALLRNLRHLSLLCSLDTLSGRCLSTRRCVTPSVRSSGPAPWRSGYAAACKAVYTGSIPVGASRKPGKRGFERDTAWPRHDETRAKENS